MATHTSNKTTTVTVANVADMYRIQRDLKEDIKNENYNTQALTETYASIGLGLMSLLFAAFPPLSFGLGLASLAASVRAEGLTKLSTIANTGFDDISVLYFNMTQKKYPKANVTIKYIHEKKSVAFGAVQRVIINSVTDSSGRVISS